MNPRPGNRSVFPCGTCDIPVKWSKEGVCCNNCSVWYHKSCEDLSSRNTSYLGRSSVIWYCCKCSNINVDGFTFNSFELHTTLSDLDSSFDSIASSCFSPLHTSSPQTSNRSRRASRQHSQLLPDANENSSRLTEGTQSTSESGIPKRTTNLRLLTINCCGLKTNRSEFLAEGSKIRTRPREKNIIKYSIFFRQTTPFIEMTEHLALVVVYLKRHKKVSLQTPGHS